MSLHYIPRLALVAGVSLAGLAGASAQSITGPSSSQSPYLVRTVPGVVTLSVFTTGDAVNTKADGVTPYRLAGIPDGLGAFDNGDGTFTLLVNHEIAGNGIVRDHGLKGAFVSKWTIDKATLKVLKGEDLMKQVSVWDIATSSYIPLAAPLSRFCSADLAPISAFYDTTTGLGYNGRIYMNGEESGTEGRPFAHFLNGNSYQLPALGRMAFENSVAHPNAGAKTVVVSMDDGLNGQVYVYVGTKSASSDPVAAAGLSGGTLFGVKVDGFPFEVPATGIPRGTAFTGYSLGDVSSLSGLELDTNSVVGGVTTFQRPEDGCWDPINPKDFYFVTTASFTGNSRLWRLRFVDPTNPAAGGRIDMLLNGTEGQHMFDNITVTKRGEIILLEDVGNNIHLGKVWRYDIGSGSLSIVAQHDPARFLPGGSSFLTSDEESSGIIPMDDILGEGWYLLDVQAHYGTDEELVEGGQLIAMHLPPTRSPKK